VIPNPSPLCSLFSAIGVGRPWPALLAALTVLGCAKPEARVGLDGAIVVLRPNPEFSTVRPPDDWIMLGPRPTRMPETRTEGQDTYLHFKAAGETYAFVRRINAQLLATPYLSWRWRQAGGLGSRHPVRISIGLADHGMKSRKGMLAGLMSGLGGSDLPDFSRSIIISFGASALMRGTLEATPETRKHRAVARYVIRGGRENIGRWWEEYIDLSNIHRLAWPGTGMTTTRVVYIGITTQASKQGAAADIARLRLSR